MQFFRKIIQTIKSDVLDIKTPELMTEPEDGFTMDAEDAVTISLISVPCLLTDSKVGGIPYMPSDFKYPLDERPEEGEKPLAFLAQINFAQMPPLKGFPSFGILQFFIGTDYLYGMDSEKPLLQAGFRVIYHREIVCEDNLLKELPVQVEYEAEFPVQKELKMAFTPAVSVIGWQDFRYESSLLAAYQKEYPMTTSFEEIPVAIRDKMEELCNASGSRIGGYPMFTQSDPRSIDNGYGDYSVLLLQLDSDTDQGISWGDDGVCNFFITPRQLADLNFSEVFYHWDCY